MLDMFDLNQFLFEAELEPAKTALKALDKLGALNMLIRESPLLQKTLPFDFFILIGTLMGGRTFIGENDQISHKVSKLLITQVHEALTRVNDMIVP